MRYLFLFLLSFSWLLGAGQSNPSGPDPEAKKILEQVEKENLEARNISYDFSLTFHFPEEDPVVQTGSYIQEGKKYHLDLENYSFVCDGTSQWVVDKEAKEIQIHDYAEPDLEDISTPQGLLKIYRNTQFDYVLTFEGNKQGNAIQEIEFKPLRKDTEYAKARLTVLKKSHHIHAITLINKDGSRYTLDILRFAQNQPTSDNKFGISEKDYAGFHIEDLRID